MKEKILCLLASPNRDGNSATLAKWFLGAIDKNKYDIEIIYLYDWPLEYLTNDYYVFRKEEKQQESKAQELFNKVSESKRIIIATPIWNFSVPAVLKNFLDRASVIGRAWSEKSNKRAPNWKDKKFYLFFTTGAPKLALLLNYIAVLQLRFTLKYYGAKSRVLAIATNCRSGSKNFVIDRNSLKKKINKKAVKF